MNCTNCGNPLEEVFEGSANAHQYKDALHIQVHLGYGTYADHDLDQDGSPNGQFCLICAAELCDAFPGIRKMTAN